MVYDYGNLDGYANKKDNKHTRSMSRYSEAYLRYICAHGSCTVTCPGTDEDVDAVDATVKIGFSAIDVQIKATFSPPRPTKEGIPVNGLEYNWLEKWQQNQRPVILLKVYLPQNKADWIIYNTSLDGKQGDFHNVSAFWQRVDDLNDKRTGNEKTFTLYLPEENRMRVESLQIWEKFVEMKACETLLKQYSSSKSSITFTDTSNKLTALNAEIETLKAQIEGIPKNGT